MKPLSLSLLAAMLLVSRLAGAQSSGASKTRETPETQIRRLEQEYVAARQAGDSAALARMLAPEFMSVASTGRVENRSYLLDHAGVTPSGDRITKMVIDSVNVHVLSPTEAVVVGRRVVTTTDSGNLRFMHVVAKRNGHWQLVAASATTIK